MNSKRWLVMMALAAVAVVRFGAAEARADQASCRKKSAGTAASMFSTAAKQFLKCSTTVAEGGVCTGTLRDAVVQSKLSGAQVKVFSACESAVATQFGFVSAGALALRVTGIATGEGRQVVDSIYGRDASVLSSDTTRKCAKLIVKQIASAGKKFIKIKLGCGSTCSADDNSKANAAFTKAQTKIQDKCLAADLTTLLGTPDPATHVATMKTNATRVVNSLTPGANPSISVASPLSGSTVTPSGLPIVLATEVGVANAPHAGYVVSMKTGSGITTGFSTYNSSTGRFERDLTLAFLTGANYNLAVQLRTYMGVFNGSSTVKFNLGSVAPDVVINSPITGAITNSSSVTVSGQIIGDLTKASSLQVNGVPTSFNPSTGAFSTNVNLSTDSVQIVDAVVQAFSVGTENSDSVVVLKGAAVGMGSKIPAGNHNRLNNSGFNAVKGAIVGPLTTGLSSQILGQQFNGGTVTEFSMGTPTTTIGAVGANTVQIVVGLPNFHIRVEGIDAGILGITCNLTDDASLVQITYQANLEPLPPSGNGLTTIPTNTALQFFNNVPSLSGGFLGICSLGGLVIDLNGLIQDGFESGIGDQLPTQINAALTGIDIAGPIGGAIGVVIDSNYETVPEDSNGVTFDVASNVINNNPVPGAPNITQTLNPVQGGSPVFGPNVPNSSTPFDLAFCLSEGFINRFMASLMLAGQFNQSINEIPPPGGGAAVPVTTDTLAFLFGDTSYTTACPSCAVTISVAPTVAAVARAPRVGENADVVLVVPNYRLNAVADNGGSPMPLVSADVTFSIGLLLGADGATISPTVGDPAVQNFKMVTNSIGADEGALASGVVGLFGQFASGLAGLFTAITLPPFELTPGQPANIYALGSGWNVSCAGLYLGFTPPPTKTSTRTPTKTATPTITGTPTQTPLVSSTRTFTASATPTRTQTPTVTPGGSPVIGTHTMTFASGSKATIQGSLGLNFVITGSQVIQFGAPNSSGVAPVVLPQSGGTFNPINVGIPGLAEFACVKPAGDGVGIIDCDGGTANRDLTVAQDHNTTPGDPGNGGVAVGLADDPECNDTAIQPNGLPASACLEGSPCNPGGLHPGACNSPPVITYSGVFGAGDMQVLIPVTIYTLANAAEKGVDGQPCTSDDTPAGLSGTTTILLTTGTASGRIFDANNSPGVEAGPGKLCGGIACLAQVTGAPINCENLRNSNSFGGGKIVGAFTGLDGPLNDMIISLQLKAP